MLDKNAKIYVAGHRGLVGSAIWKNLQDKGYTNLIGKTHKEVDLLDAVAVRRFFDEEQPEYVFLAAAFVGGIMANSIYRADFIYKNLQIQQNVIGESFNLQYGTNYIAVMPTNRYGPNDNFDLERSHVLPAMIRKIHLAHCLKQGDWDAIRKDLDLRPVEGIDGTGSKEDILTILAKYGISDN